MTNPEMCCPVGYTGLKSMNNCEEHYHCVVGVVTGPAYECVDGTLFDNALQVCNWDYAFECDETPCPAAEPSIIPSLHPSPNHMSSEPSISPAPTTMVRFGQTFIMIHDFYGFFFLNWLRTLAPKCFSEYITFKCSYTYQLYFLSFLH